MHYYKRNIGDYAKKAGRLSMLQHGAYTMLLDACYDMEAFPTKEEAIEWTWASTPEEVAAVEFVLSRFFILEEGRHIDKEIVKDLNAWDVRGWRPRDPRSKNLRPPIDEWKKLRLRIFARDNYTCVYCGQYGGDLECDHIHPVSRGGLSEESNLATACKKCNRDKGTKTIEEWKAS